MKKHYSRRIQIAFLGLLLLFSSCDVSKINTLEPTTPSALPTPPPTLSPTSAPTEISTPTSPPTATFTPVPESVDILTTTIQQSGKWDLHPPYADPGAAGLITATSDGYRLDPDFQVASIDLVYRWIGIGDRVLEYQQIERREDGFWRGDTEVPADAVRILVQAIANLHPQPQVVASTTHTDDYPYWAIELTGLDGDHLLLYSESNAPNFTPWNVIYNGKIYAQFDGQIATALPALFTIAEGETMATFWWEEGEEGYLTVTDTDPPGQLSKGFSGLLPLYRDFYFTSDPQKGELRIRFYAVTWSEGAEAQAIGPLTNVQKVELDVEDGGLVACSLEKMDFSDIEWVSYVFVCPVGKPRESGAYRYPIRITFITGVDRTYVLSGELFGYWQPGTVVSAASYPEEIGKILEASPLVGDLLSDHRLSVINSISLVDPATGLLDHSWKADVALLGQVQIGERILPYSVTIQVEVEDSKLVRWDLDRSKLQSLLRDVLNQAITRRFLDGDPDLVLNLYYGEVSEDPIVYEDELQPCADIPVASPLPAPGQPLRSFGFNQPWDFYAMQFLLLDGGSRLHYLRIDPSSPKDAFWGSLLPPELQPQGMPPFRSISKMPFGLSIGIYWDENASPSNDKLYYAMFESLNVEKEVKKHGIFLKGVMFGITPDGRFSLINCQAP